eukprot:CAMPEP_0181453314 /NCGR_PEP_ID=MMETSP1110-20121109/29661_1 /TAXON_ID=174948 /ORGANISM="Symbiodinium sp., Strain CCMP421" /LENGTH=49 /DNA_ID=CAMNT_0023577629 /DNA_START=121 /DNA_END=270 /DNA_ORIENTATION=-
MAFMPSSQSKLRRPNHTKGPPMPTSLDNSARASAGLLETKRFRKFCLPV